MNSPGQLPWAGLGGFPIATGSCCTLWFRAKTAVLSRGGEVRRGVVAGSDGIVGMACSSFGLGQGTPLESAANWGWGATDQKPLNGRLSTGLFERPGGQRRSTTRIAKGGVGIDSRGTAAVDGSCLPLLPVLLPYANQTSDCGRGKRALVFWALGMPLDWCTRLPVSAVMALFWVLSGLSTEWR